MKVHRIFSTLCTLLLVALAAGCADKAVARKAVPVTAFDEMGPFGVGVTDRYMSPATAGSSDYVVSIYYPASATFTEKTEIGQRTPRTALHGMAVRDAPLAAGYEKFPFLVFSHGLAAIRDQSNFQVQFLVSRGYVVITAEHHPSTIVDVLGSERLESSMQSALYRPMEILAEINAMADWVQDDQDFFYDAVDVSRIMVFGHSFGGYTALSVSGAIGNIDKFIARCEQDEELAKNFQCDLAAGYDDPQREYAYSDPRIVSIMPMTPGATPLFSGGLSPVKIPVFLWGAELDSVAEPHIFVDWMYEELRTDKIYAWIPGAKHLDFSQICLTGLDLNCGYEGPYSTNEILDLINELTAAFADWTVREKPQGLAALQVGAVAARYPELVYQADLP